MMSEQLPSRRTIISLSLSARNPDALLVAEALAARGVPLGRAGAHILTWAAAYLSGATNAPALPADDLGMDDDELDALLDGF